MLGVPGKRYTREFKIEKVREFLSNKENVNLTEFIRKEGLTRSNFYFWLERYSARAIGFEKPLDRIQDINPQQKLQILYETQNMNHLELGAYLRKNGLYRETLLEWRNEVTEQVKARRQRNNRVGSEQANYSDLLLKVRALEEEIKDKDKRLREIEALLDLKKKVQLLLEEKEGKK